LIKLKDPWLIRENL